MSLSPGLKLMADGAQVVGYVDADLATPISEVRRLLSVFHSSDAKALLASRVALLGRDIRRNPARHYLGRVFATAASYVFLAIRN